MLANTHTQLGTTVLGSVLALKPEHKASRECKHKD